MSGVLCVLAGSGYGDDLTLVSDGILITGSGIQTAAYRVSSDRNAYFGENGSFTVKNQWCPDSGTPGNYEARATVTLGDTPTGSAVDSWLSLASDVTWTIVDNTADAVTPSSGFLVELRRAGSSRILASANITLSAERTA